jgi:GH25 family lysozyme M1 (1,4-beta-N-acetylmuramidase)
VHNLRGRAAISVGALVVLAGVGIPAAVVTQATASTRSPISLTRDATLAASDTAARETAASETAAPANGVDVSNHNTITSWPDVEEQGNKFTGVLLTEGNFFENSDFGSQVSGATTAGMYVTPYVFGFPYGAYAAKPPNGTAQQQADYAVNYMVAQFSKTAPSGDLMLPLAIDLENDPDSSTETDSNSCYGLSTTQMRTWIQSFISEVYTDLAALGPSSPVPNEPPIIYTTGDWWDACTGDDTGGFDYGSSVGYDPLWVADYGVSAPVLPSGWGNYTLWQYSDSGTVSGISGEVDQDYLGPTVLTSAAGNPVGTVQISTLTSLQGDGDTFTSSSLPPGLSIGSSGQITGTPTTIGPYKVTVTPSAGAVPSSVPFTWDVHGTVTPSPVNQSTSAGTPVSYQVPVTDQDEAAGFDPTFTASGLPPGLSMSSSGVISGWPSDPGTYTVTATATDGLGGSGSTPFTWTIGAAADSGTAGGIQQIDGSGKCLNDTAGSTANGNQPQMWTCGTTNESWTWVQDDTIRFGGKCLQMAGSGSAADTALELETCSSGNTEQQWRASSDSEIVNPASGKCLYVGTNDPANGYKPDVHACANDLRHHYLRPAAPITSGDVGQCVAVSGSAIEVATCSDVSAQHWVAESSGEFEAASNSSCLEENGTTAGSTVSTGTCSASSASDLWSVTAASSMPVGVELKNSASGLCVAVPSASSASGTRLVMETCAATSGTPEDTWHIGG